MNDISIHTGATARTEKGLELRYPSKEEMATLTSADVSPDELVFAYGRGTPEELRRMVSVRAAEKTGGEALLAMAVAKYPSSAEMATLTRLDVSADELVHRYGRGTPRSLQRQVRERAATNAIIKELMSAIAQDLPAHLSTHHVEQTEQILAQILPLATAADLSGRDYDLLRLAVVFNAWGYTNSGYDNEVVAAKFARQKLSERHLREECIQQIARAVEDMGVIPASLLYREVPILKGRLSPYLVDARLHWLGKSNFLQHALLHMSACHQRNIVRPEELICRGALDFLHATRRFLSSHTWKSSAAQQLWEAQKQANQADLGSLIAEVELSDEAALKCVWDKMMQSEETPSN